MIVDILYMLDLINTSLTFDSYGLLHLPYCVISQNS